MGAYRPLPHRLADKIQAPRFANGAIDYDPCHPFQGAHSQSGRRGVFYPAIRWKRRTLRVNRVLLILHYGAEEVPVLPGEDFDSWFARALGHYHGRDASHSCDNAGCANFTHLEWRGHADNIADQVARRRQAS